MLLYNLPQQLIKQLNNNNGYNKDNKLHHNGQEHWELELQLVLKLLELILLGQSLNRLVFQLQVQELPLNGLVLKLLVLMW